jgi:peptide/nickel transport system substrate-binding protein
VQRLVFAYEGPTTETNDMNAVVAGDLVPLRPMYENLIGLDPETAKLRPELATEWTLEPDGASYRVKLRQGVQFHKGYGAFTSADLTPPWSERRSPDYANGLAAYWRRATTGIDIVNDYEAVYRLPRPDSNFLGSYSHEQSASMLLWSKKHFEAKGRPTLQAEPLAGTGPYQFQERAQGQYIRYQRVPYQHWRGMPDFPAFEFRWMREASTRLAALLAGEVHLASLPTDLLEQAVKSGMKVERGRVPGLRTFVSFRGVYFNDIADPAKGYLYPNSPLMDVRVRRALSKATDRDALNKAFFRGKGELMVQASHHPSRLGWDPSWERRFADQYGYDPARAKQLLAEAGYTAEKPLQTSFLLAPAVGYAGAQDVGEAIAAQWRAAGIQVELVSMEPSRMDATMRAWKFDNHVVMTGTGADLWTGVANFSGTTGTPGTGMHLPEVETLLKELERTVEPAKLDELWRKMGEINFMQHQELPLFWLPTEVAYNPSVVAGWVFPGGITGSWTHVQNIRAVR